jgi:hypothetical protein
LAVVEADALMVLIDIPNNTAQAVATTSIAVRGRHGDRLVSGFKTELTFSNRQTPGETFSLPANVAIPKSTQSISSNLRHQWGLSVFGTTAVRGWPKTGKILKVHPDLGLGPLSTGQELPARGGVLVVVRPGTDTG